MYSTIRKSIFILIFNFSLFLLLMISIQNSLQKKQVKLAFLQTISLPISFIIGTSFISGSLLGSILLRLNSNDSNQKDNK